MTDQEIMQRYRRDNIQVKMIRMALMSEDGSLMENRSDFVTTSGDLSSSDIYFYLGCYNNSSSTGKPVSYRTYAYYNWLRVPLFQFTDEVGITWGGNLNTMDIYRSKYYEPNYSHYSLVHKTQSGTADMRDYYSSLTNRVTQDIGTGILERTKLPYFNSQALYGEELSGTHILGRGYLYTTIFQNQSQGYSTKILSRYGHEVLAIFHISMSFGGNIVSPSIDLGFGYNYTYEDEVNINY